MWRLLHRQCCETKATGTGLRLLLRSRTVDSYQMMCPRKKRKLQSRTDRSIWQVFVKSDDLWQGAGDSKFNKSVLRSFLQCPRTVADAGHFCNPAFAVRYAQLRSFAANFCPIDRKKISQHTERGFESPIRIIDPVGLTQILCERITLQHNKHTEIRLYPQTCIEAEGWPILFAVFSLSQAGAPWSAQSIFGP
jgi:hypothetical protein